MHCCSRDVPGQGRFRKVADSPADRTVRRPGEVFVGTEWTLVSLSAWVTRGGIRGLFSRMQPFWSNAKSLIFVSLTINVAFSSSVLSR